MYLYVERIRDFFGVMRYTNLLFTYLLTYLLTYGITSQQLTKRSMRHKLHVCIILRNSDRLATWQLVTSRAGSTCMR